MADFVVHMTTGTADTGFLVMGDFKCLMESSNPLDRINQIENMHQVIVNTRLLEAMTGLRVKYGVLVYATRPIEETVYVLLFPVRDLAEQAGDGNSDEYSDLQRQTHFNTLLAPLGGPERQKSLACVNAEKNTIGAFYHGFYGMSRIFEGNENKADVRLKDNMPFLMVYDTQRPPTALNVEEPHVEEPWKNIDVATDEIPGNQWKRVFPTNAMEEDSDEDGDDDNATSSYVMYRRNPFVEPYVEPTALPLPPPPSPSSSLPPLPQPSPRRSSCCRPPRRSSSTRTPSTRRNPTDPTDPSLLWPTFSESCHTWPRLPPSRS